MAKLLRRSFSVWISLSLYTACVNAANATTISSDGCVAASDFSSCIKTAASDLTSCLNTESGNTLGTLACGLAQQVAQMNCYMTSCWNKVYSCEYQYLVSSYQKNKGGITQDPVPFYPAPANAPGGCSCNLGVLYTNVTSSINEGSTCSSFISDTHVGACTCCSYSAALSAFYALCPSTDPTPLGYGAVVAALQQFEAISGPCSASLEDVNCQSAYSFAPTATSVNVDALPSTGIQSLSTTSGSVTAPPSGTVFTWSIVGSTYTIRAASATGSTGAAQTSGTATTSVSREGSTGDSGSSTAAATTSKSGGERLRPLVDMVVAVAVVEVIRHVVLA